MIIAAPTTEEIIRWFY